MAVRFARRTRIVTSAGGLRDDSARNATGAKQQPKQAETDRRNIDSEPRFGVPRCLNMKRVFQIERYARAGMVEHHVARTLISD
jgi:hypothetical protein